MHTPPGAFCCCKPAQSTNRLEPVIRRAWQSVLGETSPGHLAVELAPNSSQGRTTDDLRVWSAEVAARAREPGAAAPPPLAPKVLLQSPAGRPCACRTPVFSAVALTFAPRRSFGIINPRKRNPRESTSSVAARILSMAEHEAVLTKTYDTIVICSGPPHRL